MKCYVARNLCLSEWTPPHLCITLYWLYVYIFIRHINKTQQDATVCRYLFTAKLLYMFCVSSHPSSGVHKTATAASGTGHIMCQSNNLPLTWPLGHVRGRP